MTIESVVVVGAGQAGYQIAASLRQEGFEGRITLIGEEPGLPYQRPPLSKGYLLGKVSADGIRFRMLAFFEQQRIELVHDRVTAIDRTNRRVSLASGGLLDYGHLVLATGARNRLLSVPGADLGGVLGVRTLADADALMSRAKSAKHVVVAGAGFIGLEFAAVAASLGAQVHVIELADRPMARALSRPMSQLFRAAHEGWGVTFDFNQGLAAVHGHNGQVTEVQTTSGQRLPAELLVYGIGVLPNTQLAAEAELTVDNGIEVDAHMLTRDPWISAIGDAVSFPCVHADGARLRLESVQNALDQARLVAARLAGRTTSPYSAMPWFWSDQGNLKLQIAGLSTGHDETVVIGSLAESKISVLCFRQQQLIAVESCNRPADHMVARKVLARRAPLRPAEAAAPGFELATYEAGGRIAN